MVEHAGTEKEPGVPEWTSRDEEKREHADQPPKLTMKLLYGMIQEVQQYNERIATRLDEFEHYLLEVQAARAQLEASAARTIAKAKAIAALSEAAASADAAIVDAAIAQQQAIGAVGADSAAALQPISAEGVDTAIAQQQAISADDVDATIVQQQAISSDSTNSTADLQPINADNANSATAQQFVSSGSADSATAQHQPISSDGMDSTTALMMISVDSKDPAMASSLQSTSSESAITENIAPNEEDLQAQVILHGKAGARRAQPESLMSLAMEVLGFPNDDHGYDSSEDGLDPGEGTNPFDNDSFLTLEAAAASETQPRSHTPEHTNAAALSMPFYTPRSQRHPAPKKSFLNLLGFRTRIS
ncbi:hypothetical protein PaecuDRAFT_1295 [Paenibacillus curdlanolyticus YK9]|uniref:Uncharacterized protein n=1 Tax=Paenibacillus curdlanolyticus YK9 TaxID=717606 RepID=E0I6M3_9BACL|nr:hypothetical protein [Paenibacillus curdlanolyticus]EFM11689.1 hypothetical protein PaecuDRAFT_1295 [Paenibacillus curdlanolyticus YK9]